MTIMVLFFEIINNKQEKDLLFYLEFLAFYYKIITQIKLFFHS